MAKILFVNPPSPDKYFYIRDMNRSGRRSKEKIIWPQTSLAYLAAMVDDKNEVKIIDCIAENIDWRKFRQYLEKEKPNYIVINVISSIVTNDLYAAYLAKPLGTISIAIGPHVTALPEETLKRYPSLDFCILGEAEVTLKELIEFCEKKGDLSEIRGIAYRERGIPRVAALRPLIENLDDIPVARYDLLPIDKYRMPVVGDRYTYVLASRGCPYYCSFCRQPIMWQRKVRIRSAGKIMEELRALKKIGVTNFGFHCDTFTLDKKMVIDLCKMIIAENLNLRWAANSRVDTVDEEMLHWMKKAGCWMVAYGIESGSQVILNNVKKGITLKQIEDTVNASHRAGILNWGYFVMGLPGETEETIKETIAFAKRLPLDYVNFAVGTPYPGTDFYEEALREKWLKGEPWEGFDQNYATLVEYENMPAEKIIKGIKRAYFSWYARPSVILKMMTNFNNWKHLFTLIKIGALHLFWKPE